MNEFDITISGVQIDFQGYSNRIPLKFGHEVTIYGETVRVFMTVTGQNGASARGCGETPLAAAWTRTLSPFCSPPSRRRFSQAVVKTSGSAAASFIVSPVGIGRA